MPTPRTVPDAPDDGPGTLLEEHQFREAAAQGISAPRELKRLVLALCYEQEISRREIGQVL